MRLTAELLLAASAASGLSACAITSENVTPLIEQVATFDGAMPTGVTVAPSGRIFVNFPQWGDNAPFSVAELVDGKAVPNPAANTNRLDPADPAGHFISVQSVVPDGTKGCGFSTRRHPISRSLCPAARNWWPLTSPPTAL